MTIYDPESIRADACVQYTETGPHPLDLPEDTYFARVVRSPDGTHTKVSTEAHATYPSPLLSAGWPDAGTGVLILPPRDAAKIGLYRILRSMVWQSYSLLEAVAGHGRVAITKHTFENVSFDWPDWGTNDTPAGKALITSLDSEATHEQPGEVRLLDETLGLFAPNTVLRHLGQQTIPLQIICWCAHKDQRRGLEARLLTELAAERVDDRPGRRVVIPEYFSRVARYTLGGTTLPDDADRAAAHEYLLVVSVTAEIEHVDLVYTPGFLERPRADVEIESDE